MTCRRLPLLLALGLLAVCGCQGERVQSALHPEGPSAAAIERLWWILFGISAAVFLVVLSLLSWALVRRPRAPQPSPPGGATRFIMVTGVFLPAIVLVVLLFYSLETSLALRAMARAVPTDEALTIRVIGHQWWWEVHYPDEQIVTANEFYLPVGQPVRIELLTADVIHSLWIPQLGGKLDMIPDKMNVLWLQADRPGRFRGQCAEYCGLQHARMALLAVALEPDEFQRWVSQRREPPPEPATAWLEQGREVFFAAGCAECHAIRDTAEEGRAGPDLTHIGSRLTLGAATVPNNRANLLGWIANPQTIKPGNLMPRTYVSGEDLRALGDYLETLE